MYTLYLRGILCIQRNYLINVNKTVSQDTAHNTNFSKNTGHSWIIAIKSKHKLVAYSLKLDSHFKLQTICTLLNLKMRCFNLFQLSKSVHGEELAYIFGVPLGARKNHFREEYSPQEKLFSEIIMTFWTNFARTG